MRNRTPQLKTRLGMVALICLLPFAIFAADSSSGTSSSSSSSSGDAAGKASDTSKTAAAASGLQCIMMMNMASKMDDKDLKTMTMMMALQQCAQSTSFSKASQENDNIKKMMKTAEETQKVKQLEPPPAVAKAEEIKETKVDGLFVDDNTPKAVPTAADFTAPTTSQVNNLTKFKKSAPEVAAADNKMDGASDKSPLSEIPFLKPAGLPTENPGLLGNPSLGGFRGATGGIGSTPAAAGEKIPEGATSKVAKSEERKPAKSAEDPGGAASSEGSAPSSGGGGSDAMEALLAKLNGGGAPDAEAPYMQVVDFPQLKKKLPLANIFEFARFRYEYATYKEKRLQRYSKSALDRKAVAKAAVSSEAKPTRGNLVAPAVAH